MSLCGTGKVFPAGEILDGSQGVHQIDILCRIMGEYSRITLSGLRSDPRWWGMRSSGADVPGLRR